MAVQLFSTEEEAIEETERMHGWITRIVTWNGIDEEGNEESYYAIECHEPGTFSGDPRYLHDDGYVR